MLVIAHLSDPHLDGSPEARDRLRRVTSYLLGFSRPVDVVLVTGDLADHGTEYAEVGAELSVFGDVPVLVLPGNHDRSEALRAGLPQYVEPPGHQVRDVAAARFVLLDVTVPGEDHGALGKDSLDWLREVLAQPFDGPVFVAFHQPPVPLNHPVIDQWLLRDPDGFAAVLRDHPVTALLAGHVHTAAASTFAGIPLLIAPGIRSTVPLPFEPFPGGLVDTTAPPGFALHTYTEGHLMTVFRELP